jgi:hypothetical protein
VTKATSKKKPPHLCGGLFRLPVRGLLAEPVRVSFLAHCHPREVRKLWVALATAWLEALGLRNCCHLGTPFLLDIQILAV